MTFLPRNELLSLDEMTEVARVFVDRGVRKIRITGGEPLVRKDVVRFVHQLDEMRSAGLEELAMTTNGTLLGQMADDLAAGGLSRVNVSLDTVNRDKFKQITRRDDYDSVMRGLEAAKDAGLEVKINTVALKNGNADELPMIVEWAHAQGFDISLIEVMPLGETEESRIDQFYPLTAAREAMEARWTMSEDKRYVADAGPSRYFRIRETGGRVGFISPLTNNFCAGCNRVRVTCTGRIYMCLGQDDHIDLRDILRSGGGAKGLNEAFDQAMSAKPEKHEFAIGSDETSGPARHMSLTGG